MDADHHLVLLDIDGTLVTYAGELPASACAAVRTARSHGHEVVLCTGRSTAEIGPDLQGMGFDGLIAGNGSYVELHGEVLFHQTLSTETVARAVHLLHEAGVEFYLEANSGLFASDRFGPRMDELDATSGGGAHPGRLLAGHMQPLPDPLPADVNKISFVLEPGTDLDRLAEQFDGAARIDSWSLNGTVDEFGEFGQIGIDKGRAIALLLRHVGITHERVIGFGDAHSDLPLFEAVGTSVAMGNAPEPVRRRASRVTGAVDADGLAEGFAALGLLGS